jgi:transporter family protein
MQQQSPWLLYAILSAFFAALTAIFAKAGLKGVEPDLATAIRTTIVLLITWGIVFFRNLSGRISAFSWPNWIFLLLSGMATGLSWLFYYRALNQGRVSDVSAIDRGSLLFTILLAFLFLKEPINLKIIAGALLMVSGMILIIWK